MSDQAKAPVPEDLRGLYGNLHADTFDLWGRRDVTKQSLIAMIERIALLESKLAEAERREFQPAAAGISASSASNF
jgi:hypothetical protein